MKIGIVCGFTQIYTFMNGIEKLNDKSFYLNTITVTILPYFVYF